jgi:hypothetical protein
MPIFSTVANQLRERPTPSCAARTTRPRAQIILLPLRTPVRLVAGSIRMLPTRFIQNTVSLEFCTRMRDSTASVWPDVTRIRSPWKSSKV